MPKANAQPASQEQVLLYGAVASRLRAFIDQKGWSPSDLRDALKMSPNNPVVYVWLAAKGAPSPKYRAQLAKLTGISERSLMAADECLPASEQALVAAGEKRPYTRQTTNPLEFTVGPDGTATLKLNVTMPLEQALPLLRLITDYPAMKQ